MRQLLPLLGLALAAASVIILDEPGTAPVTPRTDRSRAVAKPASPMQSVAIAATPQCGQGCDDRPAPERVDHAEPRVLVFVTLPSGEPAEGAKVQYRATPGRDRRPGAGRNRGDRVELVAVEQETRTDQRGRAIIAAAPRTRLVAQLGELRGSASVTAESTVVRIALEPDVTLRARVLDVAGRPRDQFGLEVTVFSRSRRHPDYSTELTSSMPPTDQDGITQEPLGGLRFPGAELLEWRCALHCDLGRRIELSVSPEELLTGRTVLLVVPAGGELQVSVVGLDGLPARVKVQLVDPLDGSRWAADPLDQDPHDGATRFRQVPLGKRWLAELSGIGETIVEPLDGPLRVDEVVQARVVVPWRSFALRGRIVRPDGIGVLCPRPELRGPLALVLGKGSPDRGASHVERPGEFEVFGVLPADTAMVRDVKLLIDEEPYCLPSAIVLPAPLRPGVTELGDIVVPVAPDERLLASAEVWVEGRNATSECEVWLEGARDGRIDGVRSFPITLGDRLAFRGPPTTRALELIVVHPRCLSRRVPVQLGAHVVVELVRASSLVVHARLPALPHWRWEASLFDDAGDRPLRGNLTDEGFAWRGLAPGSRRLRIAFDGQVVHETFAIDLVPGTNHWLDDGECLDLRLVPLRTR